MIYYELRFHDDTLLFVGVDMKTSTTDRACWTTVAGARDKRKDQNDGSVLGVKAS